MVLRIHFIQQDVRAVFRTNQPRNQCTKQAFSRIRRAKKVKESLKLGLSAQHHTQRCPDEMLDFLITAGSLREKIIDHSTFCVIELDLFALFRPKFCRICSNIAIHRASIAHMTGLNIINAVRENNIVRVIIYLLQIDL